MFEFKECENFNHRNILNISRIALKLHCVPKFEPDAEIGHKVPFRSLRLSAKVSYLFERHVIILLNKDG